MIDQTLRDKLVDAYVALIPLIILNVVWLLISLPLITVIPATGGLVYATNKLANGHPANWRTLLEGFKLYFWQSWIICLMNMIVIAAFSTSFLYYSYASADWLVWTRGMIMVLTILWLSIQIYLFPLLIEQEHPHVGLALRNSLAIIVKRPLFTLGVTLGIILLGAGTTILMQPAWFFITGSACAFFANLATIYSIQKIMKKEITTPE